MSKMTVLVLVSMLLSTVIFTISMQPIGALPLDPIVWTPYSRLSQTPTQTRWAMVATNARYDANYIVVVFTDNLAGQYDWYFTKSTDGGQTWTTPEIAVNPDFDVMESELYDAGIAMGDNGIVHMSFARQKTWWPRDTAPTGIYYARYDGATWSPPITIYEDLFPGYYCVGPNDITVGRDNIIHLAYGSDYPGNDNGDVWYCRSEDGGFTWTGPVNVNDFGWMDVGYPPSLAADDFGNVYWANGDDWYSYPWWSEVYFRRSQNDGVTWDSQMVIACREDGDRFPRLMCDNAGGVYVVWIGAPPYSLFFKRSTDYGSSWSPYYGGIALTGTVPGIGDGYFAELDDYGFIHIIYQSTATGTIETYYMMIDTSGNILVPAQIITPDDGYSSIPAGLSVNGDYVCVTTIDQKDGNSEAYFISSHAVDTAPPVTTIHLEGMVGNCGWYLSDVTVQLNAQDGWSGVNKTEYSFDGIAWIEYTGAFMLTAEGTTTLYFRSIDGAGNVEQTKLKTIRIDKSAPTVVVSSPQNKDYPQDKDLPISFNVEDMVSGVSSVKALITPDPATIYVDPQITATQLGETFSINVSIANALSVYCWQVLLEWDPTILHYVSVAEGGFLSSHGQYIWAVGDWEVSQGRIWVGAALYPQQVGVDGDGVLATLTFQAIDTGDSNLQFMNLGLDTFLIDPQGYDLPFAAVNGAVSVSLGPPIHDIAVTSVTASPTVVGAGEPVAIEVIVQNQGNMAETFDVSTFYDSNLISSQTQTLAPEASVTLTFAWDTTGVSVGSYLIRAEASLVPNETDTVDNSYVDGPVTIGILVHHGQTVDLSTLPPGKYTLTVTAFDNAGNEAEATVIFNVIPVVYGQLDIEPSCLNLRSSGQYVSGYIEPPEGYSVADIHISTVTLNETVPAELEPTAVGDYDSDGILDLMVKFSRSSVISYILANVDMTSLIAERSMEIALTITGQLNDGTLLRGSDTIRIIYNAPRSHGTILNTPEIFLK